MSKNLDELIVAQLERHNYGVSYAISNGIRMTTGVRYPSARILRRLRAMEKAGTVRCVGFRGNMYEWALVESHPKERDHD